MLKLEKIGRSRDISVSFRDKPRFFNKTFVSALGMALFFHLAALFLFQIAPFKIGYQDSIFTPAYVATDFNDGFFVDASNLEIKRESIPSYLIDSLLFAQDIAPLKLNLSGSLEKEHSKIPLRNKNNGFSSLEETIQLQHVSSFFSEPIASKGIDLCISGSLAELSTHYENRLAEFSDAVAKGKITNISFPRRFCYDVHVEHHRGEVFFWDSTFSDGEPYLKDLSLEILKSLRFELPNHHMMQKGAVEITFFPFLMSPGNLFEDSR